MRSQVGGSVWSALVNSVYNFYLPRIIYFRASCLDACVIRFVHSKLKYPPILAASRLLKSRRYDAQSSRDDTVFTFHVSGAPADDLSY